MDKFVINGGKKLIGSVKVPSAKNSCLALLAGCMLCSGVVVFHKFPNFSDINKMLDILTRLGCKVSRDGEDVTIDCRYAEGYEVPHDLASKIRSSIFLLGAILSKLKRAKVSYPGGCDIGNRPIDLHLKGLRDLNAKIIEKHGFIVCDGREMQGKAVHLDYPSVGATENIMMAAVLTKGTTQVFNAAKEPEIVDLQNFINKMGGKIYGAGTSTITIVGVDKLSDAEYTPIGDRIIAGTYILAGVATGCDMEISNVNYEHIYSLITKLNDSSCKISVTNDKIKLSSDRRIKTFGSIETLPYPGFPTDLQAQTLVLQTISKGTCVIVENLFETRFKHVPELIKMGADISIKNRMAIVRGVDQLYGAEVVSHDLRGGAALTIAGLCAKGYTTVDCVEHIDRGYERLDEVFAQLGADIRRTK